MKLLNEFTNELLKRKEITAITESETNPGFEIVRKKISSHFGADENLIVVNNIKGRFGSHTFFIEAFIYNSLEDRERIEAKKKSNKKEAAK